MSPYLLYPRSDRFVKICMLGFCISLFAGQMKAQAPSCTNATEMYGIFNDTSGASQSAIYPITFLNGIIGPQMGGTSFTILSPTFSVPGSASLAVDPYSKRFYYMTTMSNANPEVKDIYTYDPVTATTVKIATTPTGTNSLNDYHFVKMAFHANGYMYALGVHRRSTASLNQQVLIRFSTCGSSPATNCSVVQIMGYINNTSLNFNMFNGDIAFDYSGNMWIAVNDRTTPPGNQSYMYAIKAADMPAVPGTGLINVTLMYDLDGLDGLSVNGVAFDAAGNLFASATRLVPGTGRFSELYKITGNNAVSRVITFGPVPANSIITDLAACVLPLYVLNEKGVHLTGTVLNKTTKLTWSSPLVSSASGYEIERKKSTDTKFEVLGIMGTGNNSFVDKKTEPGTIYEYRVKEILFNNSTNYSNTCRIKTPAADIGGFKVFPTPATNRIQVVTDHYYQQLALQCSLIDISGKVVWKGNVQTTSGNIHEIGSLENISRGTYILEITIVNTKEQFHEKVILQ